MLQTQQIVAVKLAEATCNLDEFVEAEVDWEEDEPPEEFCCPIIGTLMDRPVRLPTSGQIVDYNTIAR